MRILNTYNYYLNYTVEQLLADDFFIESIKHSSEESNAFWEEVLKRGIVNKKDFDLACFLLTAMQTKKERISPGEVSQLWEDIEIANKTTINKKRRKERFICSFIAAASVLFAVGFSLFEIYIFKSHNHISIENVKAPLSSSTDIQLMLGGNKAVSLKGDTVKVSYKGNKVNVNEEALNLSESTNAGNQQEYNQLVVPFGKHSMLTFNDGTKVWVNAGTRVVYPVSFKNDKREIYIDGEIFLDVKHNEKWPFIVKTSRMEIQVKGTSFNVMAYARDIDQQVVLVSGRVHIVEKNRFKTDLHPNEMFVDNGVTTKVRTVDVKDYILWKQGLYKYDSERLDVIMKRLSRYYNESINCNVDVAFYKCSGKLDMNMDLDEVLKGISLTAPVSFNIQNGKYIISHK
ncbi:MAG: FecR family protein [Parabacteroides sp.]|nr:FecR family protein [Parabacteroides sp.]